MLTLPVGHEYVSSLSNEELDNLIATTKAIVYARVSTQDQAKHGYSLESQVDRCVALAKSRYDIDDDNVIAIIEHGEMGDDPNRPALNEALSLIEQGVGSKFIVLHPDRLARDLALQLFITDRIWSSGCDIAFVEMDVDPTNPESVLLYNIQGAISQYNKAKILVNSKRGRRTKVRKGQIPGVRRVYGYTFDKNDDILVENPKEKESYLLMVDWILNGKDGQSMNLTSVARELSILGIPAPNGDKWYQATVSRILKNPVYTGKFYYGKTEYKQNKGKTEIIKKPESEWQLVNVPAYIHDDVYEQLQKKIETFARSNRGARPKSTYLLKGLVRCGRCGSAVVAGAPSRNKKTNEIMYRYYVCSGKSRKVFEVGTGRQVHACYGRNWRQDVIDDYVWDYVKRILKEPEEILKNIMQKQSSPSRIEEITKKKMTLEKSLTEKQDERWRWLSLNAKGRITDEELDEKLTPLEKEIKSLSESLKLVNDSLTSVKTYAEQLESVKKNILTFKSFLTDKISDVDKVKFINHLIKKVVLHDTEIEIYTSWDIAQEELKVADSTGKQQSDFCSNNLNSGQGNGRL